MQNQIVIAYWRNNDGSSVPLLTVPADAMRDPAIFDAIREALRSKGNAEYTREVRRMLRIAD